MNAATAAAPKPKRSLLPLLMMSVLFSGLSGGGAYFFANKKAEHAAQAASAEAVEAAKPKEPIYHPLNPVFVVNLSDADADRYLQVEVQVMTRDEKVVDAVDLYAPVIRNRLLLLFSQQTSGDLRRRVDIERLQKEALQEVQAILKAETGKEGVEALYFTSFVTQ